MFFDDLGRYADNTAIVDNDEKITYTQLQQTIDELKTCYIDRELAFLVCSNSKESVEIYLSLLQAGIPVAMINGHIDEEHFQALLDTYRPYYLWAPAAFGSFAGDRVFGGYRLSLLEQNRNAGAIHPDLGVLLTTSGSTGSPKLVRQSYKNLQSNTDSIIEYLQIVPEDVAITTLPMHYTYGLSILHTHIASGATLVVTEDSIVMPAFWKKLIENKATTFGGVPYTYEMLKKLRFLRKDVSSLRYLTQAGGKLGKELHYEMATSCKEKGINFIVMYGQTEATARMSYVPSEHAVDKAGSIGIAIPGGELWVVDVDGNKIETPNTPGELLYQGDNVTMGYATGREDLEKGYENGNVLHTGDVAQFDEDGFFYVVGRLKRFLKLYGNRVNLDEVEGVLKSSGIECVITGVDDNMVICLLNEADQEKTAEIIAEKTTIPKFAYRICVIDEIPRNESGKIQYNVLNEQVMGK